VVAFSLVGGLAQAGTFQVRQGTDFLKFSEYNELQAKAQDWPFDVHLLAESTETLQVLEDRAHDWVNGPNVMVVAIDPVHHRVVTRYGTGLQVKTGDYDSITAAGNTHFRAQENAQGVVAIVTRAKASSEAKVALVGQEEPIIIQGGLSTGTWVGLSLLFVLVCGVAVWIWRRNKQEREEFERALDENRLETAELRARNIEHMTLPEPSHTTPYRQTPVGLPGSELFKVRQPVGPQAPTKPRVPECDDPSCPSNNEFTKEEVDRHFGRIRSTSPTLPKVRNTHPTLPRIVHRPAVAPPVVIQQSGPDFTTGLILGDALGRRHHDREVVRPTYEPTPYTPPPPPPDPEPTRSSYGSSSSDSGGSSSSYSGSSSSYGGSSSSYDSGGSSSSYDSGSSSGGGDSGGGD